LHYLSANRRALIRQVYSFLGSGGESRLPTKLLSERRTPTTTEELIMEIILTLFATVLALAIWQDSKGTHQVEP